MDSRDGSGNNTTGEYGKARRRRGYTILFISDRTEKVRSIRLTTGGLILAALLCAAVCAAVIAGIILF